MSVSTITSGIATRASAVLGSSYVALAFVEDVSRNNFKGDLKGYGVLAGDITQVQGTTNNLTVTQQFQLKIADRWKPSQTGDSNKRELIQDLQEKCLLVYKDLIKTKAGSPTLVMNILEGMYTETTLIEADGVLEMRMLFDVHYRKYLD